MKNDMIDNHKEDNHSSPVEKAPVVAEKSQGDKIPGPPNQLFFVLKNPQKARRKQLSSVARDSSRCTGQSLKHSRRDANEGHESYVNIQDKEIENQTKNTKNNGQNDIDLSDRSDPESDIEIGNEDTKENDHDRIDRYMFNVMAILLITYQLTIEK